MIRRVFWLVAAGLVIFSFTVRGSEAAGKPTEMRWAVEMEIASVDPSKSTNNWEWVVALNIYDPLLFPDPDPKKKLRPWVAESWTVAPDGKTYTFRLHKGLKFHDGSEITAEDVAFFHGKAGHYGRTGGYPVQDDQAGDDESDRQVHGGLSPGTKRSGLPVSHDHHARSEQEPGHEE